MRRFSYYVIALMMLLTGCVVEVDLNSPTPQPEVTVTSTFTPDPTPTSTFTPDPTPTRETGFRSSYNINGEELDFNGRSFIQEQLVATRVTSVTIMNNPVWACQISVLLPDAIVIDRRYSPLEGDEWRHINPDIWAQARIDDTPCTTTWIHTVNEPPARADYLAWEIRVMDYLRDRGRQGVFGHFAVGTVSPVDVENGVYDNWYIALEGDPDSDEDDHLAAVHEYTCCILSWGFGRTPRSFLLDPAAMQPENWTGYFPVARIALPFDAQIDDDPEFGISEYLRLYGDTIPDVGDFNSQTVQLILPPNWHLRRADWHVIRAIEQDLPPPRFILTEAFWDNLSDIDQGSNGLNPVQQLRNRYGIDTYNRDMRGVNSYQNLYRDYFPQWSMAEAIFCQLVYMDYMYPREIYAGWNLFTVSNNPDWDSFAMTTNEAGYYDEFYLLMRQWSQSGDTSACGNYFWN